ncbi:hypothetical protein [Halonotius roseus]|uniref:Uncharacterized protein n=1 Tax=Halonotius roseus TaxID=2511997 RepID=A0A544QNT5_9EURY|nr:hypothetical protein [Halonotius roseus]TQQ80573.1 hypothetical protein EWF95_08810 [Halonotius roseus]
MHRRSYLAGLGVGAATLAGCAGAPTDPGNAVDDRSAMDDVLQLGTGFSEPRWATTAIPTDSVGVVARFESRDALRWLVDDRESTPEAVVDFLDATDFDSAAILYLQSVGPNGCYRELAVEDVTIDDDAITATASAVDTSEEGIMCTQAITYPSAFVRVTGEDLPAATRVTLTNGWGTTAEVDADTPVIDPDSLAGGIQPDGDPPAVPAALDCATDGFERHPEYVDDSVAYGTVTNDSGNPTFALRAHTPGDAGDDLTVGQGDEIEFRLVNVSSEYLTTGNKHKYNLQLQTEAGWEEIRGTTGDADRLLYTDIGIGQRPGEGFTWSFELTEDGLLAGHPHEDDLTICPDLQPGRYRFAYWGVPDGHLAVQFDYTG